jgi:hypothetical protein
MRPSAQDCFAHENAAEAELANTDGSPIGSKISLAGRPPCQKKGKGYRQGSRGDDARSVLSEGAAWRDLGAFSAELRV